MAIRKVEELRNRAQMLESGCVGEQTASSCPHCLLQEFKPLEEFHRSSVIKTDRLLMDWWGLKCLWRALSLCGFMFVLPSFSHCSQPGDPWCRRLTH